MLPDIEGAKTLVAATGFAPVADEEKAVGGGVVTLLNVEVVGALTDVTLFAPVAADEEAVAG